jgi:CRP/FNR family transcriptional regulator
MFSQSEQVSAASKTFVSTLSAPPSLQSLFSRQPVEKFDAGAGILWEGGAASHVFEVAEGVLRVFRILSDGRRAITGFLYAGDILGVSLKDRYLYSAEAVTPTKVRRFTRNRFREQMARFPELRPQLFARLCDEVAAAQDQMVLLARKNAEERVCSFLLQIARRMDCDRHALPVIEIPMSRLDMADYLGLTIETVSRTMTKLTNRGVIAPTDRHGVMIRKFGKLVLLAGGGDEDDNRPAGFDYTQQAIWPN